jgi:hypothetical protein
LKELLENQELAVLAEESEDKLFSTTTLVGEAGTVGTAETEAVAEAAAALVEDIFYFKKRYWVWFWQKTKRKRASVNFVKVERSSSQYSYELCQELYSVN